MRKKDKDVDDAQDFTGMPASTAVTAADIQPKEFSVSRFGGYRMRDVDEFLDQITESMTKLADENERLRSANGLCPPRRPIGAPDLVDTSRQADEIIERARAEAANDRAGRARRRRPRQQGGRGGDRRRPGRRRPVPLAGTGLPPAVGRARPVARRIGEGDGEGEPGQARGRATPSPRLAPPAPAAPAPTPSAAPERRDDRALPPRATQPMPPVRPQGAAPSEASGSAQPETARRSAWRSRRRPRSAPATRTTTPDRARAETGRSGSCSGARSEPGRPPDGGRPRLRRRVRPDRPRGHRARGRAGLRRRAATPRRRARRERRRSAAPVARRRQALGVAAFRRVIDDRLSVDLDVVPERVAVERRDRQLDRERLAGDVVSVTSVERCGDVVAVAEMPSSIRSLTSRPAALRASWTARTSSRASALAPELVGELEVERHGDAAVRRDAPPLGHVLRRGPRRRALSATGSSDRPRA